MAAGDGEANTAEEAAEEMVEEEAMDGPKDVLREGESVWLASHGRLGCERLRELGEISDEDAISLLGRTMPSLE